MARKTGIHLISKEETEERYGHLSSGEFKQEVFLALKTFLEERAKEHSGSSSRGTTLYNTFLREIRPETFMFSDLRERVYLLHEIQHKGWPLSVSQ